jgi:hypothetical protein
MAPNARVETIGKQPHTMGIEDFRVFTHPIRLRGYTLLGEQDYGIQPGKVETHLVVTRAIHSYHILRKGEISWSF